MMPSIQIIYAPLPEDRSEESAALECAKRANAYLQQKGIESSAAAIIQEDSFESALPNDDGLLLLIVISCAADGSIHRLVRKASKRLGGDARFAVALLGHARCDNSAKQMNQTIFGAGRRTEKTLSNHFATIQDRLETQIELVGPEQDFDPWLESLVSNLR
jgi:hypothetical protein